MYKYNDPLFIDWNRNAQGEAQSIALGPEEHQVVKNKIYLNQIPDEFYRVHVPGMTEVKTGIKSKSQFRVDYTNGEITFHKDLNEKTVTGITYYGRGVILYPASRIYTHIDDLTGSVKTLAEIEISIGESAEILENLQKSLDQALKDTEGLKEVSDEAAALLNTLKKENTKAGENTKKLTDLNKIAPSLIEELTKATNKAELEANRLESINADASENRKVLEKIYTDITRLEEEVNNMLDKSLKTAKILEELIEEGQEVINELLEAISKGESLNEALNNSIKIAEETKNEIANIIEGTDYEVLLERVAEVEQSVHTHENLSTLELFSIDEEGQLSFNDKPFYGGDMETLVYDPTKSGVVVRARDSDSLGGLSAKEYVKQTELEGMLQGEELITNLQEEGFLQAGLTWGDFLKKGDMSDEN